MADAPHSHDHAVTFYEYPKLIYVWPIIVLGLVLWFFTAPRTVPDPDRARGVAVAQADNPDAETTVVDVEPLRIRVDGEQEWAGWLYLFFLFIVILTIAVDVERNYAVFWAVAFGAIWLLGLWLRDAKAITVFGDLYNLFADLNVSYNRSFGLAMSIFLAVPYIVMLIWARINHRWRITHNEFEHYSFGRADDSLARGAKRVRSTYPDILEFLLCGAGTLIVYSATGRSELRRIHNVPLLFLVRRRINRILERTLVTTDHDHDQAVLDEEAADEAESSRPADDQQSTDETAGQDIGDEKL